MIVHPPPRLIACLLSCALGFMTAAQEVVLRPRLAQGETLLYELTSEMKTTVGNLPPQRLTQRADVRVTVAAVEEDGGALIRIGFSTIEASHEVETTDTVRWREGVGLLRDVDAGGEPLEPSRFARVVALLGESVLEVDVSRSGEVGNVRGLGQVMLEARRIGAGEMLELLGALSPAALRGTLGQILEIDPGHSARSLGARWQQLRTVDLDRGWRTRVIADFELKSLDAERAVIEGTTHTELRPPLREVSAAEPTLELGPETASTRIVWAIGGGHVLERMDVREAVWRATVDGGLVKSEARLETRTRWRHNSAENP